MHSLHADAHQGIKKMFLYDSLANVAQKDVFFSGEICYVWFVLCKVAIIM